MTEEITKWQQSFKSHMTEAYNVVAESDEYPDDIVDAIVAFSVPYSVGHELYQAPFGTDPVDMHITLAKLEGVSESRARGVVSWLSQHPLLCNILSGEYFYTKTADGSHVDELLVISGTGRFNGPVSDAFIATVDGSTQLDKIQQVIVETLSEAGLYFSSTHGFTPHVTLSYLNKKEATPELDVNSLECPAWTPTHLELWVGNQVRYCYRLKEPTDYNDELVGPAYEDDEFGAALESVWEEVWLKTITAAGSVAQSLETQSLEGKITNAGTLVPPVEDEDEDDGN